MPRTVIEGSYEWDSKKALANQIKHGVSFEEASTTMAHPQAAVLDDGSESGRLRAIGLSRQNRVLTVVFEGRGERDRIISAWKSTRKERRSLMKLQVPEEG